MIELFGMSSPNVRKVGIMLEELGVDYVLRHIAVFRGEQFEPGFLALNPLAKVPVLLDHTHAPGKPLIESAQFCSIWRRPTALSCRRAARAVTR